MKKNIMPFCFSHMSYLSLGTEVAREGKKQATITAITYMYISYVLMDNNAFLSYWLKYTSFAEWGYGIWSCQIILVMMLINNTGENVKCSGTKSTL